MPGEREPGREIAGRIAERASRSGVVVTEAQAAELGAYIGLLTKWNRRLNLTALLLEPLSDDAIDRLLIEPVIASSHIRRSDKHVVDIGSGGGSPAIPLKIMSPWLDMVLVESRVRKAAFLREAVREVGLAAVEVQNSRFEDAIPRTDSNIDVVTIRAVRADSAMWEDVASVLAPSARVLWFRSPVAAESQFASPSSSLVVAEIHPLVQGKSELVVLSKAGVS